VVHAFSAPLCLIRDTNYQADVPPVMMLLDLFVAFVFGALKWQAPLTQGKEEDRGIGFGKNDISRFILIMFCIILACSLTNTLFLLL
jgi:hypothetical protein